MTPLFAKLNLKHQQEILVLNAPHSFEAELTRLRDVSIHRRAAELPVISFAIVFAQSTEDLKAAADLILPKAPGDPVVWFAYPKTSSKKYRCDFNRDTGWDVIGSAGFEGVRQVAIDEDWSALRFRRVEHIKTMTRASSRASSPEGRKRTAR